MMIMTIWDWIYFNFNISNLHKKGDGDLSKQKLESLRGNKKSKPSLFCWESFEYFEQIYPKIWTRSEWSKIDLNVRQFFTNSSHDVTFLESSEEDLNWPKTLWTNRPCHCGVGSILIQWRDETEILHWEIEYTT